MVADRARVSFLVLTVLTLLMGGASVVSAQSADTGPTPSFALDGPTDRAALNVTPEPLVVPGNLLDAAIAMNDSGEPSVATVGLARAAAAFVQNAPVPPEPEHSGFVALFKASVSDFKAFPRRTSTWVILGLGGVGALAAHPVDDTLNAHLVSDTSGRFFAAGKWIGNPFVVTGTAVGLWGYGRWIEKHPKGEPRTSKIAHIGFDLMRVQILSQAIVQGLKYSVRRDRPTGECCAFPSGHAASAFATASVLERHFGYRNSWPAMLIASYVAASRLHDNRHFLSDVVFGASVGVASGWTVVGQHGRSNYALMPVTVPGGVAVMVARIH
jgi:membrane-associated phospholipid phosphatase